MGEPRAHGHAAAHAAAHGQAAYAVRLDWGPTGAAAIASGPPVVDVAVVVDVLSFTTTVTIAVERGLTVLPFAWGDERAAAYAAEHDAVLAVGRFEARDAASTASTASTPSTGRVPVTLSPAAMTRVEGLERLVLPSPNGSTICATLSEAGVEVLAGCLRNAAATAEALAPRLAEGARLAVVAAGERWPDATLRPCAEDLWGAGAVLAALVGRGAVGLSPEAALAVAAWHSVAADPAAALHACAGGRELAGSGFVADVDVAAAVDVSSVVPCLRGGGGFTR